MAAAAFRGTLIFRGSNGQPKQYPITASDVAAEYYIFPDGNNVLNLPSNLGVIYLVDIILSAAGTDTTVAEVYANGKFTGEKVQNSANLATNQSRQFNLAPIAFAPGAQIRFTQRAS